MEYNNEHLIIPDTIKEIIDDEQRAAVGLPISDICVTAIAGSGKTRVLTCRVATLIYNGYMEDSIILLTFTNKASNEIIRRVGELIPNYHKNILYGTFHSVCCHFLRKYCDKLGLMPNFGVVTPQEQAILMQGFRDEHIRIYFNNDEAKLPSGAVLSEIYSGAINKNITFNNYIKQNYKIPSDVISNIIDFFESYEKYKEINNKVDYDGMLLYFYDLLTFYPEVKEEINSIYKHILVDEYQDINWLQHDILQQLNAGHSLFAIGDPAQCIYQFRGSEPRYIIDFDKSYPTATMIKLSRNYRSCENILKLAENSINHNGFNVHIESIFKYPEMPEVYSFKAPEEEAEFIAKNIQKNIQYNGQIDNVAILVRTGKQQKTVMEALKRHNIKINSPKEDVFNYRCIKRLFALMFYCEAPDENLNLKEALKSFNGVGEKLASEAIEQYSVNGKVLKKIKTKSAALKNALSQLDALYSIIKADYGKVKLTSEIYIKKIMSSFLKSELSDKEYKLISALSRYAPKYRDVISFYDDLKKEKINLFPSTSAINVMTMHSAKGLEWDYVYLPFITNNVFPKCPFWELDKNTEFIKNERNLFYVAITRAKEKLYISYSTESKDAKYHAGPSIFLKEIDKSLYIDKTKKNKKAGK